MSEIMALCNRCDEPFLENELTHYGDWVLCEFCEDDL